MATAAVVGLSAGKRLLSSSFYSSDLADKLFPGPDHGSGQFLAASTKCLVVAKNSSDFGSNISTKRYTQAIRALKEHVDTSVDPTTDAWFHTPDLLEDGDSDFEYSLEALILFKKSMLEKQWRLTFDQMRQDGAIGESRNTGEVTRTRISARQRRINTRRRCLSQNAHAVAVVKGEQLHSLVSPELLQIRSRGYVRGRVSTDLLTHAEVVHLSKKIRAGLTLEEHRSKLKEKLGFEPSDKQLASALRMPRAELCSKLFECSLAKEKLAMSNVRLVISIAQKYDKLGVEMPDLIQGGLMGLLRGIEKFDSSKGCKIATYVYWWIRQGVSRTLVKNSRTLRLPAHLHERLSSIRNAKIRLEEKGIAPSIDKLAESLNMSQQRVRNATEAVNKVWSLDREAFPSRNGLPGQTLHSYIADNNLENNPSYGFDEWSLKDEVNKLLDTALRERERDIIRMYYGLDKECQTWEDISKKFGLSRERVRQIGLVAMEKLKNGARRRRLDAMLVKH